MSLARLRAQGQVRDVDMDELRFTPEETAELEAMGHTVEVRNRRWGNMHGVMWDRETGEVTAGSDPRWPSGRAIVR